MRSIIGTILNSVGIGNIRYAADGRRGLEAVHEFQPDICFVDYEMPVMNGLDFISAVRTLSHDARYLPIIMLSGHSDLPRIVAARDRGVTEFLSKPVTAKLILQRLEAVILNPRPFIDSEHYFGPDRRRTRNSAYDGELRRASDKA